MAPSTPPRTHTSLWFPQKLSAIILDEWILSMPSTVHRISISIKSGPNPCPSNNNHTPPQTRSTSMGLVSQVAWSQHVPAAAEGLDSMWWTFSSSGASEKDLSICTGDCVADACATQSPAVHHLSWHWRSCPVVSDLHRREGRSRYRWRRIMDEEGQRGSGSGRER